MYLSMTALTVLDAVIGVRLTEGPCEDDDSEMHEAQAQANQVLRGCHAQVASTQAKPKSA